MQELQKQAMFTQDFEFISKISRLLGLFSRRTSFITKIHQFTNMDSCVVNRKVNVYVGVFQSLSIFRFVTRGH